MPIRVSLSNRSVAGRALKAQATRATMMTKVVKPKYGYLSRMRRFVVMYVTPADNSPLL